MKSADKCESPEYSRRKECRVPMHILQKEKWTPPRSPFNLVQETLYHDPWQLLVATTFLTRTSGEAAIPVLWKFLEQWPNPESVNRATLDELAAVLEPLGLHRRRAYVIKRMTSHILSSSPVALISGSHSRCRSATFKRVGLVIRL
ncbi:methyl-CpG-binding domain protein 4-like isoform X2 [Periplaneta americana]|uniref:methyl-CpG-binding domain protein 4-like isoform X2 n=1 Tax=Periplaneta americana TaxID=6978 RepID=UPI0037E7C107